jgi:hypothetical protein
MNELMGRVAGVRRKSSRLLLAAVLSVSVALLAACQTAEKPASGAASTTIASNPVAQTIAREPASPVRSSIGCRSKKNLDEHFAKHGGEFRGMSKAEYLLAAQTLRDAPVGGDIEEIVRSDGTTSRFDKASGAFIAFNSDGTIRTFFKPNDGERYFRRQAQRSH